MEASTQLIALRIVTNRNNSFACQQCTLNSREQLLYSLCFRQDLHLSPGPEPVVDHKSCFCRTVTQSSGTLYPFPSNMPGLGSRGSWKEAAMGSFKFCLPKSRSPESPVWSSDPDPAVAGVGILVHTPTPRCGWCCELENRRYPGGLVGS